ncbi:MAG: flagellar hook-basal body complex protein FliE [Alphaproteobacteria bacterium]|nr:flagellar hook-basal body complex protein FliE [Alphaproteobacteria bacterium]
MTIDFQGAIKAYNNALQSAQAAANGQPATLQSPEDSAFAGLVKDAIGKAIGSVHQGEEASKGNLAGTVDLQSMIAAVTDAELTVQTVVAIRDKVISAYEDIIRMPI